jgi:hypothetical protein
MTEYCCAIWALLSIYGTYLQRLRGLLLLFDFRIPNGYTASPAAPP